MDATDLDFTVDGARRAAELDLLDEWVHTFLSSPGSDNPELGEQLTERERWWLGPLPLAIDSLNRLAGPPGDPVLVAVGEDEWRDDVDDMAGKITHGAWRPPPVIVTYRDGQFVLEDGNHRVEALRRSGLDDAWAVIGFDHAADRDHFITQAFGSKPGDRPQ